MGKAGHLHFANLQRSTTSGAHQMGDSVDMQSTRMLWRKGIMSAFPED